MCNFYECISDMSNRLPTTTTTYQKWIEYTLRISHEVKDNTNVQLQVYQNSMNWREYALVYLPWATGLQLDGGQMAIGATLDPPFK